MLHDLGPLTEGSCVYLRCDKSGGCESMYVREISGYECFCKKVFACIHMRGDV